jgi:hypothetical protein
MTTLELTGTDAPVARRGVALVRLNQSLWRITRPGGAVLGYVERFPAPAGVRYRAKRFQARQGRFVVDGEFWRMDDAIECLRR